MLDDKTKGSVIQHGCHNIVFWISRDWLQSTYRVMPTKNFMFCRFHSWEHFDFARITLAFCFFYSFDVAEWECYRFEFCVAGPFVKDNLEPIKELRTVNNWNLLTFGTTIFPWEKGATPALGFRRLHATANEIDSCTSTEGKWLTNKAMRVRPFHVFKVIPFCVYGGSVRVERVDKRKKLQ